MTAWEEVRDLIEDHDLPGLGALMAVLDDAERQEVARELPRHLKALRRELGPWGSAGWAEPMRVAGAGSFGGTAAVAAWLNRRDFVLPEWRSPADSETLVEVISARDPQWQADLVARLTLRIRNGRSPGAPLVMTLLRRTGVTPPQHDPLVVAWVAVPPAPPSCARTRFSTSCCPGSSRPRASAGHCSTSGAPRSARPPGSARWPCSPARAGCHGRCCWTVASTASCAEETPWT
ncbi:hypothetical protein ACFQX6_00910 [Streptosporangium lutulentum]